MSTPGDPREQLLSVTAEAARAALYERCDEGAKLVATSILAGDDGGLSDLPDPAMCVTVSVESSAADPGGVWMVTSAAGARALAVRSLDPLPPEASDEPLEDGDLEAAREWGGELIAAVVGAAREALGSSLTLGAPRARILSGPNGAQTLAGAEGLCLSLSVHGEACLFVLALPEVDARDGRRRGGGRRR